MTTVSPDVIEHIDLTQEVDIDKPLICEIQLHGDCDRPADLLITCHHGPLVICQPCWVHAAKHWGWCEVTGHIEGRDEHMWIVEALR